MKLRIGGVPYGVGAPLLAGLDQDPDLDFVRATPTRLVSSLRDGELDAALVSSIEAYRQPGYTVVPDLCIASRGPARSVRAFKRPGTIRSVGLDNGSATSVTLLQILLHEGQLGETAGDLDLSTITPTATPDDLPHDLIMMIGNFGLSAQPGARTVFDLGELWHRWTGLPFVFALWLLAPGSDSKQIVPKLVAARREALATGADDGTAGAIYYDLGPDELRGLARFHVEAAALDLADAAIEPSFLSVEA